MRKHHVAKIYESPSHLFITILFIVAPFLFFLFFSRLSHFATSVLFQDIFISLSRIVIAYLFAVVVGWVLAVSFYRGKSAAIALPIFDVLQSFPTFAALPLAVFFWGPSTFTIIFFLVITIIWPIFFSIISSLKLIRNDWEEAAEIAGLRGFSYVQHFLLPASIPGVVTGSIIGLGEGWEAVVATEIIAGMKTGLGPFFQHFSQNPTITAFGILGFLLLIFSMNKLIWLPLLEWSHRQMEE